MTSFLVRKLKLQDSGENKSKILAGRHDFLIVYTVWLELDGGQYPTDFVNVTLGEEDTTELPVPQKSGFRFEGWYSDPTFTVKVTKFSYNVTRLYAKWVELQYTRLEWVQNQGNYVNTGIRCWKDTRVTFKFVATPRTTDWGSLYGASHDSATVDWYNTITLRYEDTLQLEAWTSEAYGHPYPERIAHKYNITTGHYMTSIIEVNTVDGFERSTFIDETAEVQNVQEIPYPYDLDSQKWNTSYPRYDHYIFCCNINNSNFSRGIRDLKFREMIVEDVTTGETIGHLYPALDESGIACIYDEITNTYKYPNTGSLIPGPEV